MNKSRKVVALIVIFLVLLATAAYVNKDDIRRQFFKPKTSTVQQGVTRTESAADTEIIAQNLTVPWETVFLPDGGLLVTERSGTLRLIGGNGGSTKVEGVAHVGEGGLLGMALHPDFVQNKQLYLYLTTRAENGLVNRVDRYHYEGGQLSQRKEIIAGIPGAANHDGGRIAFGPDKLLYITTGDAGNEQSAQDKTTLAGKILRLTDEGGIPADNPFNNAVYSYGHRNPQGLAWDNEGRLWSTEHGRSGLRSGYDELNLVKKGANYGWPITEGDESRAGMERPVAHSGASDTWAPAGLAYHDGKLFFGGLRGQSLYAATILPNETVSLKAHLSNQYGRIRNVALDGGQIYITTSNTDGRGTPKPNDDKLIRLDPGLFK